MTPHVIVVGSVRIEMSPTPAPLKFSPPTPDDGNRLVREFGGAALVEALAADAGPIGMGPSE